MDDWARSNDDDSPKHHGHNRNQSSRSKDRLSTDERQQGTSDKRSSGRVNFEFRLFVSERCITKGLFTYGVLEKIGRQTGCSDVFFDERTEIPDLPGQILVV